MYQVQNNDGTWPGENQASFTTSSSTSIGWDYSQIRWPPKKLNVCERFILRCAQWTIRRLMNT